MSFFSSILPILGTVAGSFLGPAGAAIGGAIGGGLGGAFASDDAADAQQQGAQQGIDTQWRMWQEQQKNLAPWLTSGQTGNALLQQLLGIGGTQQNPTFNPNAQLVRPFGQSDFQTDPGYQFRMNEGLNSILNKRSALGGVSSGNTLRDFSRFNQGLASDEYQNAYNRYRTNQGDVYSRLSGMANTGANAASGLAGIGSNVANNVSSLQAAQGAYGAAGILGQQGAGQGLANNFLLANSLRGGSGGGGQGYGGNALTDYLTGSYYSNQAGMPYGYESPL